MTLPTSSFAEAKRLLGHCKEATRLADGIGDGSDRIYARFRVPLFDQSSVASNYLLYAAIQAEFGSGSLWVEDDDAVLSIPLDAVKEGIPVHRLEQGLHRVRKALLSALEQRPDGSYSINKRRMHGVGMTHVDLEDLAHALVTSYDNRRGEPSEHHMEPRYTLPKGVVYIDRDHCRHIDEVSQDVYAQYMSEKQRSGLPYIPFSQAEARLNIDGHILTAVYREMGVSLTPTRTH